VMDEFALELVLDVKRSWVGMPDPPAPEEEADGFQAR